MGRPPHHGPEDARVLDLIRKNLIKFRQERGLSQEETARAISIPVDTLRRYEQGARRVDLTLLGRFGDVYGHSPGDFWLPDPPPHDPRLIKAFHLVRTPKAFIPPELEEEAERAIAELNRRVSEHDQKILATRPRQPRKK